MEPTYHVAQTQHGFRNELGEMTEMALYAHLQVRLGLDMAEAEGVIADLEKHSTATINSPDGEIQLEVRRTSAASA